MCCFSRPVISVSQTNIFARSTMQGHQLLVYSMNLNAKEDLAMILPIPVKPHSGEKAVHFINLEKYPNFFKDMQQGFIVQEYTLSKSMKGRMAMGAGSVLEVLEVGSFQASFVPTLKDFSRLDARFRLPAGTWEQLPQYKEFGFAVFKLKPGAKTIHPMAFEFPRADPHHLFFPTVHIHDGKVHATAMFDHSLFYQRMHGETFSLATWKESASLAKTFMKVEKTAGMVLGDNHCYRMMITGRKANRDFVVG